MADSVGGGRSFGDGIGVLVAVGGTVAGIEAAGMVGDGVAVGAAATVALAAVSATGDGATGTALARVAAGVWGRGVGVADAPPPAQADPITKINAVRPEATSRLKRNSWAYPLKWRIA